MAGAHSKVAGFEYSGTLMLPQKGRAGAASYSRKGNTGVVTARPPLKHGVCYFAVNAGLPRLFEVASKEGAAVLAWPRRSRFDFSNLLSREPAFI